MSASLTAAAAAAVAPADPPRWLNEAQGHAWRNYLLGSARLAEKIDADLRKFGVDHAEYEILVRLEEAPDRKIRMSELADAVHQSRSRLTHTITRMERDGHVVRTTVPTDRRGVWAQLTDTGKELLDLAAPSHVNTVRDFFVDVIDPDDFEAVARAFAAVVKVTGRSNPGS